MFVSRYSLLVWSLPCHFGWLVFFCPLRLFVSQRGSPGPLPSQRLEDHGYRSVLHDSMEIPDPWSYLFNRSGRSSFFWPPHLPPCALVLFSAYIRGTHPLVPGICSASFLFPPADINFLQVRVTPCSGVLSFPPRAIRVSG